MSKKLKNSLAILIAILMIIIVIYCAKLKFTNPDMTEMRLVMTFWKEYLISSALLLIGYFAINKLLG